MKVVLIVLSLLCFNLTFGQLDLTPDTLLYEDRIGGSIDTFDISTAYLPTTFDNGRTILSEEGMSTARLYQDYTQRTTQSFATFDPMQFSALPKLGFAYSFGSQSSQFVRMNYTQALSNNLLLSFKYDRNVGNGFLQNAVFANDNVRFQLQRLGNIYSFKIRSSYQSARVDRPDGVVGDSASISTIDNFGLEFSSVNKSDAEDSVKLGFFEIKNYINFTGDSINQFGLTIYNEYDITNRVYRETGDLASTYNAVYIDSFATRDQQNWARTRNAGGLFYSNRKNLLYLDGLIQAGYWNYQNNGFNTDTLEVDILGNLRINVRNILLESDLRFNLIGAFNEWKSNSKLQLESDRFNLKANLFVGNVAPDPFIRAYRGNNFQYSLSTINNQFELRTGGLIEWTVKDSAVVFRGGANFNSLTSVYIFDSTSWVQSNNAIVFSSFKVEGDFKLGNFYMLPKVIYTADNTGYLPQLQAYGRFGWKAKLFKAKILESFIGIDASYISKYQNRAYIPALDVMTMSVTGSSPEGMFNLHAFASFGIKTFRFYARMENIGYFWNDRLIEVIDQYPIAGTRFRIGITWDFVN